VVAQVVDSALHPPLCSCLFLPDCVNFCTGPLHKALSAEGVYDIVELNMVPYVFKIASIFFCEHGSDDCATMRIEACTENIYNSSGLATWFPFIYCLGEPLLLWCSCCWF
jgi:hypothetical protein